jgi:hypothetical protein
MAGGMGRAALAALAALVHDMAQSFACSELLSHRAPWPVWDAQGDWGRLASVPRSPCRALERSIHLIVATRNAPARLGRGPSSATDLRPNAQSALACKHGHAHTHTHSRTHTTTHTPSLSHTLTPKPRPRHARSAAPSMAAGLSRPAHRLRLCCRRGPDGADRLVSDSIDGDRGSKPGGWLLCCMVRPGAQLVTSCQPQPALGAQAVNVKSVAAAACALGQLPAPRP